MYWCRLKIHKYSLEMDQRNENHKGMRNMNQCLK
jgi:hypothetical protein